MTIDVVILAAGKGTRMVSDLPKPLHPLLGKPLINYVIDASDLRYVGAANEGDAIAISAGAELAGKRSVTMFHLCRTRV